LPIYEYECESCKHRFEVMQRFSDPPVAVCSLCHGRVRKLVSSPVGLHFKGGGWYVTDYAKKGGATDSDTKPSDTKKEDAAVSTAKAETKETTAGNTVKGKSMDTTPSASPKAPPSKPTSPSSPPSGSPER